MPTYFWKAPLRMWDAMFERGVKAHLLATYVAMLKKFEKQSRGH